MGRPILNGSSFINGPINNGPPNINGWAIYNCRAFKIGRANYKGRFYKGR